MSKEIRMKTISGKKGLLHSLWGVIESRGCCLVLLWTVIMVLKFGTVYAHEKPPELVREQTINGALLDDFATGFFEGTRRTVQQ